MKLNEKLYSYRKKAGMSQQELAEYLDVSRQTVSKWETGMTLPSAEKLIRLSKLIGAPLDVLTDDSIDLTEGVEPSLKFRKNIKIPLSMSIGALAMVAIIATGILAFNSSSRLEDESIPLNQIDSVEVEDLERFQKDDLACVDQ